MSGIYNPFTYNPRIAMNFYTPNALPDSAARLAQARPDLANHINSVWQFSNWLKTVSPQAHSAIAAKHPELLDPEQVITSGSLSPSAPPVAMPGARMSMRGMGDATTDATSTDTSVPTASGTDNSSVFTQWGSSILDTINKAAPSLLQIKSQNDLMNINIQRAAQGLPPIDSSTLAPTVNVGVSKDLQTLGFVAVGGLVLVGLFAAFKKSRK